MQWNVGTPLIEKTVCFIKMPDNIRNKIYNLQFFCLVTSDIIFNCTHVNNAITIM